VCVVEGKGIPYLLMGGAGTVTFGRCRATDDIDIFVRVDDADRVLDVSTPPGSRRPRPSSRGCTRPSATACWST